MVDQLTTGVAGRQIGTSYNGRGKLAMGFADPEDGKDRRF